MSESRCCLTSHFSFKENKVLKKNTIQIIGQIMRPSQKIRASASVAAILFGETCCGKVIHAIIFIYFTCASVTCWGASSSGLCAGWTSDLHEVQKEARDFPQPFSPCWSEASWRYLSGFKNPVAFPIFIYLVPPAEAHHEPSSHILREMDKMTLSRSHVKRRSSAVYWRIK